MVLLFYLFTIFQQAFGAIIHCIIIANSFAKDLRKRAYNLSLGIQTFLAKSQAQTSSQKLFLDFLNKADRPKRDVSISKYSRFNDKRAEIWPKSKKEFPTNVIALDIDESL